MSNQVVTTEGVMTYDDSGWAFLKCCRNTQRYYQYWLEKCGILVQTPIWKSHVSVVRSGDEPDPDLWGLYDGQPVQFQYNPLSVGFNGIYWWVDIESPQIEAIRIELGLDPQPKYDLHLTVGKEKARRPGCQYGQQMLRE